MGVLFILNQSAHLTRLAQSLGGDIRCPKSQPRDKALPPGASAQLKLPGSKAQSRFQGHLLYHSRKQGSDGLAWYPGLDVGQRDFAVPLHGSGHNRIKKSSGICEWWAVRTGRILTDRAGTVLGEVLRRHVSGNRSNMAGDEAKGAAGGHRSPQAWRARWSRVNHKGSTVSSMPLLHSTQILSARPSPGSP